MNLYSKVLEFYIAFMTTEEAGPKFILQVPQAFRHVSRPQTYGAFSMNPVKEDSFSIVTHAKLRLK
jgi:hypothetical protein